MNYNTTPLPRILNARDIVTGYKFVTFSKRRKRYIPNPNIPSCRSGEEHLIENYDLAKKDNFKSWGIHHRLELTLDGEFANSAIDLVNKDMYFHRPYYELIWLTHREHARLHNGGGKYTWCRDKSPHWKGDDVTKHSKRMREHRARRRALKSKPINIPYEEEEEETPERKIQRSRVHSRIRL